MTLIIHLPEHTCLETLLPVSGHNPRVPSSLHLFSSRWKVSGWGWRSQAIWPVPYPHRIGKRCPGVTCLLIVYLRACRVSCEPHVQSSPEPKKQRKKRLGSQSSKNGSLPTTHSPRLFSPHPHPALCHTLYFSVTYPVLLPLKAGMVPLLSQQRSQKEVG